MTKKQLAYEVIERLKTEYPDAAVRLIMMMRGSFW